MVIDVNGEKLREIFPNDILLPNDALNKILSYDKEYKRSVELGINDYESNNNKYTYEKMLKFLKFIVAIEILILDKYERPKRVKFSQRVSWLLGTNRRQRNRIQNQIGTLYAIRNSIAHSFIVPIGDEEFEKFFENDFLKAIKVIESYHALILLRLITDKDETIPTRDLIDKLNLIYTKKIYKIPFNKFYNTIAKDVSTITNVPSSSIFELKKDLKLPNRHDEFFIGIDTYGGLIELTHESILLYKEFSIGFKKIIPEENVWKKVVSIIKTRLNKIQKSNPKKIHLLLKAHHSILFSIGFYKIQRNPCYVTEFNEQIVTILPWVEFINDNKVWNELSTPVDMYSNEIILILNISRIIGEEVRKNTEKLNIKHLNIIELGLISSSYEKQNNIRIIKTWNEILIACKALEDYIKNDKRFEKIKTVHLFTRCPTPMMILLGMHFRNVHMDVVLYENMRSDIEPNTMNFYKSLTCKFF